MLVSHHRVKAKVVVALALLQFATGLLAYPFEKQFVRVTDYGTMTRNGLATADFSGDGIDEIFLTTADQVPLLVALTQEPGGLRAASLFPLPAADGVQSELHIWPGADGPSLVAVSRSDYLQPSSLVRIYRGWPLRETTSYAIPSGLSGSAVGDLNNDGIAELVAMIGSQTQVLNLSDGQFQWSLPTTGQDILLANLDVDAALEIALAGTPGRIYDGVTRQLEWSYPDGFGSYLAAGRIGSGGSVGFVGALDWGYFTTFQGTPWSPVWDFSAFDIDAVAVANLDATGADEIIEGDGQWGSINIIDAQTRLLRLAIPNPGHGVAALAAVKTANTAGKDIVFAPNSTSGSNNAFLRVVRSSDGQTLYDLRSDGAGVGATSIGDLDADGQVELVVASNSYEPGRMRVIDRDSGTEEWLSPPGSGNANDPFYIVPRFLFQTQLDDDTAMELVVAGASSYAGRIIVLDGLTKAVQLQIGDYSNSRPLDSRAIVGAVLVDYDGDGFKDLAVATSPTTSAENGARLHVFSLRTGVKLWESIRMGAGFSSAVGVHLQQDAGHDVLVAALPDGLRAFGVQSQLLEWTHSAQIRRAVYLQDAPGGAEILLEDDVGTVSHLDAASRLTRRSYQISEPSTTIVPVPGAARIVVGGSQSLALMTLDGTVLGVAPEAITMAGLASPVAVAAAGSRFDVLTGTPFGYTFHKLDLDVIFQGSFEAD